MLDNFWTVTWTRYTDIDFAGIYVVAAETSTDIDIVTILQKHLAKYNVDAPKDYTKLWFRNNFDYFDRSYTQKWSRIHKEFAPEHWKVPTSYKFDQMVVNPYIIFLDKEGDRVTEEKRFERIRNANS